jgi:hypothetical protein
MSGAIHPFPQYAFMAWCSVKNRDNFTFYVIFPTQLGLNQRDTLSPLLFNFAVECATRKVLENEVGLELNETHQILVYADNIYLLSDSINIIKDNTELF